MSAHRESLHLAEKGDAPPAAERASFSDHTKGRQFSLTPEDVAIVEADQNQLHRNLKGRHMQMIAMYVVLLAG
jgi:amino acid transporter